MEEYLVVTNRGLAFDLGVESGPMTGIPFSVERAQRYRTPQWEGQEAQAQRAIVWTLSQEGWVCVSPLAPAGCVTLSKLSVWHLSQFEHL